MIRIHSQVGMITNSSTIIYSYYNENAETALMRVGKDIATAMGFPVDDPEKFFYIEKTISSDAIEEFFESEAGYVFGIEEEQYQDAYEAMISMVSNIQRSYGLKVTGLYWSDCGNMNTSERRAFYHDVYQGYERVLNEYVDVSSLPLNYERGDMTVPLFDLKLMSRHTNMPINIMDAFYTIYSVDYSCS